MSGSVAGRGNRDDAPVVADLVALGERAEWTVLERERLRGEPWGQRLAQDTPHDLREGSGDVAQLLLVAQCSRSDVHEPVDVIAVGMGEDHLLDILEGQAGSVDGLGLLDCETTRTGETRAVGELLARAIDHDLPPLTAKGITGSGQTIVVVDSFGSPTIASDLAHFDSYFKLPAPPSFRVIQPAGPVPAFQPGNKNRVGWAEETTLDVEWAHVIAPGARIVLVETPTYLGALQAFSPMEPEPVSVASDDEGVRVDDLIAKSKDARFVYLLPNFQNPTGRTMTEERRAAVSAAATKAGLPIVEDNPYGELWFEEAPPLPLTARNPEGCIYLG